MHILIIAEVIGFPQLLQEFMHQTMSLAGIYAPNDVKVFDPRKRTRI
jgi:hypothetical protein